jgi:CHAT domain-containing protein
LENADELSFVLAGQFQSEIKNRKEVSPALYEKMWAPVAAKLSGVKTLYFSPDGIFHKINLNALRWADGSYLVDNLDIRLVTNLREILSREKNEPDQSPGLAVLFGNPTFKAGQMLSGDLSGLSPTGTEDAGIFRDLSGEFADGDFHLSPLPGSGREVNAIAKKLTGKNWQTSVFTGAKATEDTLKQLKSPKVLHIATHGYFLNSEKTNSTIGLNSPYAGKNPALRSMLFFAGAENSISGENTGRNDGILTAFEAAVLNLDQTELVVLSACNTGLGKIQNGEGVYGLQRAFRIAGAKSLIMSLWEVEDAATELLMNSFYENWLSGMSKSEAFRKAQLTLKAKYPQPFYWGSFILVNG